MPPLPLVVNFQPVDGEYLVVANYSDRILGAITAPTNLMVDTDVNLSNEGYTIELRHSDGRIINTVYKLESGYNGTGIEKSAVLVSSGEWSASENDLGVPSANENYCSPGQAAAGEY